MRLVSPPSLLVIFCLCVGCSFIVPVDESIQYPDSYQKGMTIFFKYPRNRYSSTTFKDALDTLKVDGVNSLYLVPYWFTSTPASDSLFRTVETIADSDLGAAIAMAQSYGFEVVLKPHIDVLDMTPRCRIRPNSLQAWCRSYQRLIDGYVSMANHYSLKSFVVGTELDGVADNSAFLAVVDSIRRSFKGELLYAASVDHFVAAKIWDYVDYIGVNGYFNLDNSDSYSMTTLMDSWNYWLNVLTDFSVSKGKPVVLTEAGYFSRNGAAKNPGTWDGDTTTNLQIQADCYESLLSQAIHFPRIKGIFWWQWELADDPTRLFATPRLNDATPQGKPAEAIIRKYWSTPQ